jgi:hypothetical protein
VSNIAGQNTAGPPISAPIGGAWQAWRFSTYRGLKGALAGRQRGYAALLAAFRECSEDFFEHSQTSDN